MKPFRSLKVWFLFFVIVSLACGKTAQGVPPGNALVVEVAANASLTAWLSAAAQQFNGDNVKTSTGKPVYVVVTPVEAGQAVLDINAKEKNPTLWIPDNAAWADILAEKGVTAFQGDCASLATSPLVIGMWRSVAESLGWPGRALGWLDIGSLAADSSAWAYYSGGQFGDSLRLGHTHPGVSGSGASTLLAIVQAAQSKQTAVSITDIQQPIVQASVSAFEGAVSWFGSDTDQLGKTMKERGVNYLGAAVMYESTVIQYFDSGAEIVPVYPFEGTFVATHPACLNSSLSAEQQEAALAFRQYLLGEAAQQLALTNGLRPVNPKVALGAPLDAAHNVDLAQPALVFEPASAGAIRSVQELWLSSRKGVNLVMALDTSGSMQGSKLINVQKAAIEFINHMGEKDYLTLLRFSAGKVEALVDHQQIGETREDAVAAIEQLTATGNTPLYDALGYGAEKLAKTTSSQTTNALVVLTDGMDTASKKFHFNDDLIKTVISHDTTVFAIAYGSDAEEDMLSRLALQANGNFYLGDEANIAEIYDEMSTAFGGSIGIGR